MRRPTEALRTQEWLTPTVVGAGLLAMMAGFAQFGVTAALGELAAEFGEPEPGGSVAAQVGLTGTTLGLGLAVIRLASLGGLPVSGLADRYGRRRVLLVCCAGGLALTVGSGLALTYWWFVAIFALGRPLLAGTDAVAGVIAAEETDSADRSKAVAVIAASYAVGSGLVSMARGVAADVLGFRGVFLLAAVPLALLPLVARLLGESERYARVSASRGQRPRRPLQAVPPRLRGVLATVCMLHFGVGFVTGPINSYLFAYGEGVVGATPGAMAGLIVAAGPLGLAGLLVGRLAADRVGRRATAGSAMGAAALAGMVTYAGGDGGFVALGGGYLATMVASSVYAPAAGALDAELFPTSVRSTAAGWVTAAQVLGATCGLAVFGMLADVLGAFGPAAAAVSLPVAALSLLYARLPETRGLELEESAPEQ